MVFSFIATGFRSLGFGALAVALGVTGGCADDPAPIDNGTTSTDDSSTSAPTTTSPTDPDTTVGPTTADTSGSASMTTDPTDTTDTTTGDPTDTTTGDPTDTTTGDPTEATSTGDPTDATTTGDPSESSGTSGGDALPDITGDHLLAIGTVADPSLPLQYLATVVQTADGDGALLDVSLQPLTLDVGSTTDPRLPFGNPIVINDVAVAADGSFAIDIGQLDVAAETNPLTGSDAAADNVVLTGQIVDADNWCGVMTGDLVSPIQFDLAGSTFAATATGAMLPVVFPVSC